MTCNACLLNWSTSLKKLQMCQSGVQGGNRDRASGERREEGWWGTELGHMRSGKGRRYLGNDFSEYKMQRYSAHNRNVAVQDQGHDV